MKVSVIILNWNGAQMLRTYLPSVVKSIQSSAFSVQLIVADNGSTDESLDVLAKEFPTVKTIVLDKNYGFAEGYNKAIEQVDSEYVVLLNSDVEVTEGWLAPLLDYMDAHPEVAAVQPKIRAWRQRDRFEHAGAAGGYLSWLGYPYCRGRRFGKVEQDHGQYDTIAEIDWTTGAAMCVREYIRSAEVLMQRSLPIWKRSIYAGVCETEDGYWHVYLRAWSIIWEAVHSVMTTRARPSSISATTC